LEFVVSAGSGGSGIVYIDDLAIRELPPTPSIPPPVQSSASSSAAGAPAQYAVDGLAETAWRSSAEGEQWLTLDLGYEREFGGLVLRWAPGEHASRYDVEYSGDGENWRLVQSVEGGDGGSDPLLLSESQARYVRLHMSESAGRNYALAEIEIRDLAFGVTPSSFYQALAREAPRGSFPRGMSGEQVYWTLVGVDGGAAHSALMSEDGALELGRSGVSVEPFILTGGRRYSWADVEITQSLRDGYLPIPNVTWRAEDWDMSVTAFAAGDAGAPVLYARYELHNRARTEREMSLVLAVRPFQVNPPQQFLNTPGGFSPIHSIEWNSERLQVNGAAALIPVTPPSDLSATAFDDGSWLVASRVREGADAQSEQGFAAAALVYNIRLQPGQRARVAFAAPLAGGETTALSAAAFDRLEREVAADWRRRLNRVDFRTPELDGRVVNSIRSAIAHMLMSRDRAALQPGTRSYARSWIRDGAMMSEGLLRVGLDAPAREYLDWYAPFQFANGKVPCCVDRRGADPVPENDSHGEFIHLTALLHRYTHDDAQLERVWPRVAAAAAYMETLRRSERTDANRTPERSAYFGLMPPSISHEGYSARPAYSYWDNFWALRGYEDAVYLAETRGDESAAAQLRAQRDEFRVDLYASLSAAMARHNIDYIPGAADLGDFDATSTTIALAPGGQQAALSQTALHATFEQYWRNFVARRDGVQPYNDYTPYELRTVGAFIRLGWRERANEALDFFFRDQRPRGWNQWAEVVGREPREPRFIGDMPHGWVASDYLRSALDMFVYERQHDEALVLAAGAPADWFTGSGFAIENLRTPYGRLSYSVRREGEGYRLRMHGDARPPGGFVLALPVEHGARLCFAGDNPREELRIDTMRSSAAIRPC
jgi:hypothetical protein